MYSLGMGTAILTDVSDFIPSKSQMLLIFSHKYYSWCLEKSRINVVFVKFVFETYLSAQVEGSFEKSVRKIPIKIR